jgi:hypothetical protein
MTRRTDTELDPPTPTGARTQPRPSGPTPAPALAPRPLVPARPAAPKIRGLGPAQPGRRDEAPSDMAVTSRLERVSAELTPAPLPPSPATADADQYFEQVPTNPGAQSRRDPTGVGHPRKASGVIRPAPPPAAPAQPWFLPLLLVATGLAVGMVLGALLFANRSAPACAPCPPAAAAHAP